MGLDLEAQAEMDEDYEHWLRDLIDNPEKFPAKCLEAAERNDTEAFYRELQIAFLAEEFEAMMFESGDYRPILRRDPDGTINTYWIEKEEKP